jgi:hypothetical protein
MEITVGCSDLRQDALFHFHEGVQELLKYYSTTASILFRLFLRIVTNVARRRQKQAGPGYHETVANYEGKIQDVIKAVYETPNCRLKFNRLTYESDSRCCALHGSRFTVGDHRR